MLKLMILKFNQCWAEGGLQQEKRCPFMTNIHETGRTNILLYIFRWNKSVWTRFGPNCVFWPVRRRQTNTRWSKVSSSWEPLMFCCCKPDVSWLRQCSEKTFFCLSTASWNVCVPLHQASLTARWEKPDRWWQWQETVPTTDPPSRRQTSASPW